MLHETIFSATSARNILRIQATRVQAMQTKMAVEEWGLRRRQNFVNLLLSIDSLDRDEEERKVKRERVIWIREWPQRRKRGAYNQLVQ